MKKIYLFVVACLVTSQLYAQEHVPDPCPAADAGPDVTIPPISPTIGPSTVIPGAIYSWSPSRGLSNPNVPNPSIFLSFPGTYTYTLTMTAPSTNLVVNGDFSQGNTGFGSQYTYIPPGQPGDPDLYTVATNPQIMNGDYCSMGDHTTGNGNMMIIDGSRSGSDHVFWGQWVPVQPYTDYTFSIAAVSAWVVNPAILTVDINNLTVFSQALPLGDQVCQWQNYQLSWNSGSETYAHIVLYSNSREGRGNDFAIDDIKLFTYCPPSSDAMTVTRIRTFPPFPPLPPPPFPSIVPASEEAISGDVSIYPNPAQRTVNVQLDQSYDDVVQVEIRDRYGKIVQSDRNVVMTNGRYSINLQGLPGGIYTLSVQSKKGITTKQLVIDN